MNAVILNSERATTQDEDEVISFRPISSTPAWGKVCRNEPGQFVFVPEDDDPLFRDGPSDDDVQ